MLMNISIVHNFSIINLECSKQDKYVEERILKDSNAFHVNKDELCTAFALYYLAYFIQGKDYHNTS